MASRIKKILDAGDHGDDERGGHGHVRCPIPRATQRQDVEGHGKGLQHGLELAALGGRNHIAPACQNHAPDGDAQLADHDHDSDPPPEITQDIQADQGGDHQCFVRDGVGQLAEIGDDLVFAGQEAVQLIGKHQQDEGGQSPPTVGERRATILPIPRGEDEPEEHRNEQNAHAGEHIGQAHGTHQTTKR